MQDNVFYKKGQKFMLFDFETEGLNLVRSRPFQLSWIVADSFNVISEHDEFIFWPDLKMSDGARKITKFDNTAYKKKALPPKEVYERFSKYLFDPSIIISGHNILNFDIYIVKTLQKLLGLKTDYSFVSRCVDTKVLFLALQKNIKYTPGTSFLEWQFKVNTVVERGLKSNQLFMLNYFDIPHDKEKLHEALYDTSKLYECFKKMMPMFEIPDLTIAT